MNTQAKLKKNIHGTSRTWNNCEQRLQSKVLRRDAVEQISAQVADMQEDANDENENRGSTARLVLWTQVHENYGAHDWDGKGECPQHWKAKGGSEYHVELGSWSDVLALALAGSLPQIAADATEAINRKNEYWDEYVLGWEIFGSAEETDQEEEDAYFAQHYGISRNHHPLRVKGMANVNEWRSRS